MDVMKLADPSKSSLQHLDIGLRRHRLDFLGVHASDEAIHQLAPGPETVRGCSPNLGKPRHSTLEGVTVQIADSGKPDPVALVAGLGPRAVRDARDPAVGNRDPDVARPALRQQGFVEEYSDHPSRLRSQRNAGRVRREYV